MKTSSLAIPYSLYSVPTLRNARHVRHYSNATLRGNYIWLISGTRPTGPHPRSTVGLAIANYDGQGNLFQTYGTSHGSINEDFNRPRPGTYSINEDCSGTMVLQHLRPPPRSRA